MSNPLQVMLCRTVHESRPTDLLSRQHSHSTACLSGAYGWLTRWDMDGTLLEGAQSKHMFQFSSLVWDPEALSAKEEAGPCGPRAARAGPPCSNNTKCNLACPARCCASSTHTRVPGLLAWGVQGLAARAPLCFGQPRYRAAIRQHRAGGRCEFACRLWRLCSRACG